MRALALIIVAGVLVACGGSASALAPGEPCPVTEPNGSMPPLKPGERVSANHHGDGNLWTSLWSAGKVVFEPGGPGVVDEHGLAMKWVWWLADTSGQLQVEGRRLDAAGPPLEVIPPYGGKDHLWNTGLLFPTVGCWEVTGRAGDATLTFVTEVVSLY